MPNQVSLKSVRPLGELIGEIIVAALKRDLLQTVLYRPKQ
jgi:hypothetical protein